MKNNKNGFHMHHLKNLSPKQVSLKLILNNTPSTMNQKRVVN